MEQQENKGQILNEGNPVDSAEEIPNSHPVEAPPAETKPRVAETPSSGEPRSRMIMAGVFTAAILAVIAVVVAGVFQVTSKWLITCPHDLPVNDPAPILWSQVTSTEKTPASLGVSQAVAMQVRFKGVALSGHAGKEN